MTDQQPLLPQNVFSCRTWIALGAVIAAIAMSVASLALRVWETRSNNGGEWGMVIGVLPALIGFF